jgi:signal transduction histidine kinase
MPRPTMSWVFVGALFLLCSSLGYLQYTWIGEVSVAARDRLRAALQVNLVRLSQDLNTQIASSCRALLPSMPVANAREAQADIERGFERWKKGARAEHLLRRVALAVPEGEGAGLRMLDQQRGTFERADWPIEWAMLRQRIESRLSPAPGQMGPGRNANNDGELTFESPIFGPAPEGFAGMPFGRREVAWVIFDLNVSYVRDTLLPEVLLRHLEAGGALEYQVEVVTRTNPPMLVYQSDPSAPRLTSNADGSIGLLELRLVDGGGRGGRGGRGARGGGIGPGGPEFGRWEMYVRHRAGSLDAVVEQARWRNLAVTGGVLLLLVATLGALVRFTRNAQRLAQLQLDFVAGVSHELRTPLTAIYTAGHNLRGRVAHNPAQVERYGEMIQKESGRLKDLVEQVLRFASAGAGKVIQEPTPLSVESVIDDSVEASRTVLQAAHCTLERNIEPQLPAILGDPLALKHALQNLLSNAVKYGGAAADHWIGVSARGTGSNGHSAVEIRVADHGPGIPEDEQAEIFDAFFRGRRANQEQIHGAGLGLNLVKKVVEAHGGTIRVESKPAQGTEFIVSLPAWVNGAGG